MSAQMPFPPRRPWLVLCLTGARGPGNPLPLRASADVPQLFGLGQELVTEVRVGDLDQAQGALCRGLAAQGPADGVQLAESVANKLIEKHHVFLDEELLSVDYASARLDPEAAWQAAVRVSALLEEVGDASAQAKRLP